MALTYAGIRSPAFGEALRKIATHPFAKPQMALRVVKIVRDLEAQKKDLDTALQTLIKAHAATGENGEPVDENGQFKILDEKKAEWEKASDELLETTINLSAAKINAEHLEGVGLSAMHMIAIEGLLNDSN